VIREKLESILEKINDVLGEWSAVAGTYCPEWTQELKEAQEELQELIGAPDNATEQVLKIVAEERVNQNEKWGEQNHHPLLWFSIIGEEYGEMCHTFNEYTFDKDTAHLNDLKREAIHTAACCIALVECMVRQEKEGFIPDGERNVQLGRTENE
jgi:NTP pyrophosphatase (non-canonical NTP hydrolase)